MAFISVTQLNAPYFLDCSLAIQIISLAALIILSLSPALIYIDICIHNTTEMHNHTYSEPSSNPFASFGKLFTFYSMLNMSQGLFPKVS